MSINAVTPSLPSPTPTLPRPVQPPATGEVGSFGNALKDLIGSVEQSSTEANQAVGRMLTGTGDVHEAMIAMQRADTMLQLTVQVRNKLVQAYQDVMRMSV